MSREDTRTPHGELCDVSSSLYLCIRNNAGNLGRLDGSCGNMQHASRRIVAASNGRGGERGVRAGVELCGVPRGLCGRRARKTPELHAVYIGEFDGGDGRSEIRPTVTNEREKGAKVHMRRRENVVVAAENRG